MVSTSQLMLIGMLLKKESQFRVLERIHKNIFQNKKKIIKSQEVLTLSDLRVGLKVPAH